MHLGGQLAARRVQSSKLRHVVWMSISMTAARVEQATYVWKRGSGHATRWRADCTDLGRDGLSFGPGCEVGRIAGERMMDVGDELK